MSLIKVIQESGIKNNSLFQLKNNNYEIENLKQVIKEKDVIIDNNNEKINELECHVAELKEQCVSLLDSQEQLTPRVNFESTSHEEPYQDLPSVMQNYEKFIAEITTNYEIMKEERNRASTHLANLEFSFQDLVEKYERLKEIVVGYQQNQKALLDQIETYENAVEVLQTKYDKFKKYATEKINEANLFIKQNEKNYISELAKVKSQVLQSKVKISELESTLENNSSKKNGNEGVIKEEVRNSLFTPLATIFQLP